MPQTKSRRRGRGGTNKIYKIINISDFSNKNIIENKVIQIGFAVHDSYLFFMQNENKRSKVIYADPNTAHIIYVSFSFRFFSFRNKGLCSACRLPLCLDVLQKRGAKQHTIYPLRFCKASLSRVGCRAERKHFRRFINLHMYTCVIFIFLFFFLFLLLPEERYTFRPSAAPVHGRFAKTRS